MFVNSGQLNPYPLYLELVLGSNSLTSLVWLVYRMPPATVMDGQEGKRERGNSNTDKAWLLRAANRAIVISFLVCAASRAIFNVIIVIQFHDLNDVLTQQARMRSTNIINPKTPYLWHSELKVSPGVW